MDPTEVKHEAIVKLELNPMEVAPEEASDQMDVNQDDMEIMENLPSFLQNLPEPFQEEGYYVEINPMETIPEEIMDSADVDIIQNNNDPLEINPVTTAPDEMMCWVRREAECIREEYYTLPRVRYGYVRPDKLVLSSQKSTHIKNDSEDPLVQLDKNLIETTPGLTDKNPIETTTGLPDKNLMETTPGLPDKNPIETTTGLPDKNLMETTPGLPDKNPIEITTGLPDKNPIDTTPGLPDKNLIETTPGLPDKNPIETTTDLPDKNPIDTTPGLPDKNPIETTPGLPDKNPIDTTPGLPDKNPIETTPGLPDKNPIETTPGLPEATVKHEESLTILDKNQKETIPEGPMDHQAIEDTVVTPLIDQLLKDALEPIFKEQHPMDVPEPNPRPRIYIRRDADLYNRDGYHMEGERPTVQHFAHPWFPLIPIPSPPSSSVIDLTKSENNSPEHDRWV